jgi:hypothetical protein
MGYERGGGVSGAANRSSGELLGTDGVRRVDAGCATETGPETSALASTRNAGRSDEHPQVSRAPASVCLPEWWWCSWPAGCDGAASGA